MKSIRTAFFLLVSGLFLPLTLTSCGLKGDLYLPADEYAIAASQKNMEQSTNSTQIVENSEIDTSSEK